MNLSTITEDPHVARRAFLDYRAALREPVKRAMTEAERELRAIDDEMMRAYRNLAKGVTLLRLSETVRAGGITVKELTNREWHGNDKGWQTITRYVTVPNLGIAKADIRDVWTSGVDRDGDIRYRWTSEDTTAKSRSLFFESLFGKETTRQSPFGVQFRATVPTVPPQFRPPHSLSGYHVLVEAQWDTAPAPADPALLKHVGGDLWAVLATWDLTPLEAAVLGQRR